MINLTKIFIENGNALFTVEGINEYRRGGEDNEYGDYPKIFRVSELLFSHLKLRPVSQVYLWVQNVCAYYQFQAAGFHHNYVEDLNVISCKYCQSLTLWQHHNDS